MQKRSLEIFISNPNCSWSLIKNTYPELNYFFTTGANISKYRKCTAIPPKILIRTNWLQIIFYRRNKVTSDRNEQFSAMAEQKLFTLTRSFFWVLKKIESQVQSGLARREPNHFHSNDPPQALLFASGKKINFQPMIEKFFFLTSNPIMFENTSEDIYVKIDSHWILETHFSRQIDAYRKALNLHSHFLLRLEHESRNTTIRFIRRILNLRTGYVVVHDLARLLSQRTFWSKRPEFLDEFRTFERYLSFFVSSSWHAANLREKKECFKHLKRRVTYYDKLYFYLHRQTNLTQTCHVCIFDGL